MRHKDSGLTIQADGQSEFEMGYDSAGDFYPHKFDAVLRPKRKADGTYGFTWFQGGGAVEAKRIDPLPATVSKWTPTDAQLPDYVGLYPLTQKFGLRIFVADGQLNVQGTNQRPLKLAPVEQDIFVAEIRRRRDRFCARCRRQGRCVDTQTTRTGPEGRAPAGYDGRTRQSLTIRRDAAKSLRPLIYEPVVSAMRC